MPDTTAILSWLWEKREEISRKLAELYDWFRGKGKEASQRGILILGPGGVGKTTLARLLAGEYNLLFDLPGEYNESLGIERYTLQDAPGIEIVVPPGQQHRREATWAELLAEVSAGHYRGIILLSAYGYHSLGQSSYKSHHLYRNDKDEFLQAYLEMHRAEEVTVLRQLMPHLRLHPGKLWFLSLIAKEDLWWPNRLEAEKHYTHGDYGTEIERLLQQQDQRRFRHESCFASLVISNFATGRDERLKANAEGYDHQLQVSSLRRLFETVDTLKNWEAHS
jgi:hypothetical protein